MSAAATALAAAAAAGAAPARPAAAASGGGAGPAPARSRSAAAPAGVAAGSAAAPAGGGARAAAAGARAAVAVAAGAAALARMVVATPGPTAVLAGQLALGQVMEVVQQHVGPGHLPLRGRAADPLQRRQRLVRVVAPDAHAAVALGGAPDRLVAHPLGLVEQDPRP